jgi:hypothetical protein
MLQQVLHPSILNKGMNKNEALFVLFNENI